MKPEVLRLERVLSQDEIDRVFRSRAGSDAESPGQRAEPFDFRRPDRLSKDQLRAIHLLHDNFARSLASSLSAYLRAYIMVNLVSVEQLSFVEFSRGLPSPTSILLLSMMPFDGNAVLELNPSLFFPVLEMLLGGSGKSSHRPEREITEIEQSVLESLYRLVLRDLETAWASVGKISFQIEGRETQPTLLQILAPNEAVVAIGMEVKIGDFSGMMNIGIPSIIIKMLRQKFDNHRSMRRTEVGEAEQSRILRLIRPAQIHLDARLQGPMLQVDDLLRLEEGDVLTFDFPVDRPVDLIINGCTKFKGAIQAAGRKKALQILGPADVPE